MNCDIEQLQLADQTAIVDRQRDLIAKLRNGETTHARSLRQDVDSPELSPPSNNEDGLVSGGNFVYHHVKLRPADDELEIAGEIGEPHR